MLNDTKRQRALDYLKTQDKSVSLTELTVNIGVNYYSVSAEDLEYFNLNCVKIIRTGKKTTKLQYET